ncbi:SDR family NAD(P)-dependent oxidoreductase [Algicola sagamiensis]|uniref:SDR family NAD(P)-dependent oxidoreductase n=1 Tax=Algicola sagamiensis TaxID=163869 RepID=UPI0003686B87|nr:SDR family NAD(P)-dependent oxidoreductase [Algicola sagamiensis]
MTQYTAVVSGAASGIGLACTKKFLVEGINVIGLDLNESRFPALREELQGLPGQCQWIAVDVCQEIHSISDIGLNNDDEQLVLVNNIGGSQKDKINFDSLSWDDMLSSMTLNLKPAFILMQLLLPIMKAAKAGRIINISSIASRMVLPRVGADYQVAKAALNALSRKVAAEYAADGVQVNTICPGIIGTERILARWEEKTEAQVALDLAKIPQNRLGTPEEIAEMVFFLASPQSVYLQGAVIDINGGLYLA